jgi:uncharacterized protein
MTERPISRIHINARVPVREPRGRTYTIDLMSGTPLCVYCRQRPVDEPWRPFCSERCKMADLGRWLTGAYRVPVRPDPHTGSVDDLGEPPEDSEKD